VITIWYDLKSIWNESQNSRNPKISKTQSLKNFSKLFDEDTFKIKIRIWGSILAKVNVVNAKFQSQHMEMDLKLETYNCIWEEFLIAPKYLP